MSIKKWNLKMIINSEYFGEVYDEDQTILINLDLLNRRTKLFYHQT